MRGKLLGIRAQANTALGLVFEVYSNGALIVLKHRGRQITISEIKIVDRITGREVPAVFLADTSTGELAKYKFGSNFRPIADRQKREMMTERLNISFNIVHCKSGAILGAYRKFRR